MKHTGCRELVVRTVEHNGYFTKVDERSYGDCVRCLRADCIGATHEYPQLPEKLVSGFMRRNPGQQLKQVNWQMNTCWSDNSQQCR